MSNRCGSELHQALGRLLKDHPDLWLNERHSAKHEYEKVAEKLNDQVSQNWPRRGGGGGDQHGYGGVQGGGGGGDQHRYVGVQRGGGGGDQHRYVGVQGGGGGGDQHRYVGVQGGGEGDQVLYIYNIYI
uniref:Uncharacterized protein n=1 Tax=Glossina pallidipes TaxID=7398 RepID=A0A1A9ZUX1_GLOPL